LPTRVWVIRYYGHAMSKIAQNLTRLQQRIQQAGLAYQRDTEQIQIVAVSKMHSVDEIRQAYAAGLTRFGESYLQEALPKIAQLQDLPLEWHFIGPIQSNKTRAIAEHFDWVHSVDRLKIAERLNEQRPHGRKKLNICIQVNISEESSKSGILHEAIGEFARQLTSLSRLKLRGLMAIPSRTDDQRQQRAAFSQLRALFLELREQGIKVDTLSMGMTDDLEAAVMEGATMLRIGTGVFGVRGS